MSHDHDPRRYGGNEYAQSYNGAAGVPDAGRRPAQPVSGNAPVATAPAAVSAATGTPPALSDDFVVVPLSMAYPAHDVNVTELRFRKPTGADAVRCGYPVRMVRGDGGDIEYKVVPEAVSKLIVALATPPIPRSTVDRFDMRDWNACSSVVNSFFLA